MCLVCSLANKKVAEKKVAITVFSFPPDKGNVGTAAYLNVFGSIYRVLQDLKAQGYTIEDVPEKEEDLIKMVSTQMTTLRVVAALRHGLCGPHGHRLRQISLAILTKLSWHPSQTSCI